VPPQGRLQLAQVSTEQDSCVDEPESVPLLQARVSDVQVPLHATDELW
jgi:hypothetical protein